MSENKPPSLDKDGASLISHLPGGLRPWAAGALLVVGAVIAWRWTGKESKPGPEPAPAPVAQAPPPSIGTIAGPAQIGNGNTQTNNFPAPPVQAARIEVEPLRPGRELTPKNGCTGPDYDKPGGFRLIMGDVTFYQTGYGQIPIMVGGCPLMTVDYAKNGISVRSEIYDEQGTWIASLHDNTIEAVNGGKFFNDRSGGLNAISIKEERDHSREILYINYLNPFAMVVRGVFGCNGRAHVRIDDSGLHTPSRASRATFKGGCIANSVIGLNLP